MIRVAIYNREAMRLEFMYKWVYLWAKDHGHNIQIYCYKRRIDLLQESGNIPSFDVLLLDYNTSSIDGLAIIKCMYEGNKDVFVLLIKGNEDVELFGYNLHAFSELIESKHHLSNDKAFSNVLIPITNEKHFFKCAINGKHYHIPINDILYFESQEHYILLYTQQESIKFKEKMYELEKQLPKCFLRIQRSMIVNIEWIYMVNLRKVVLKNRERTELSVGRKWLNNVKEVLFR